MSQAIQGDSTLPYVSLRTALEDIAHQLHWAVNGGLSYAGHKATAGQLKHENAVAARSGELRAQHQPSGKAPAACGTLVSMLGRLLEWFGFPGLIQPFEYHDEVIGHVVSVKTSRFYTTITVDGTDYCFRRETGRFDGRGFMSLGNELPINRLLAGRIRGSAPAHAASEPVLAASASPAAALPEGEE